MAKISTYASDNNISLSDKLIGTDAENNNATKNFSVGGLLNVFENSGALLPIANAQAFSLVTQQCVAVGTAKTVEFEVSSFSNDVTTTSNQISFTNTGKYRIEVNARVEHTSGGGDAQLSFWLKYLSTNVANSRQVYTIANTHIQEISYSFVVDVTNTSDPILVQWSTTNLAARLIPTVAATFYPASPSVVLNVYRVG